MRSPTKADIAKVQEWLGHANVSTSAYTTPENAAGGQPDVQG
jgi:site-specific recombinase XerC